MSEGMPAAIEARGLTKDYALGRGIFDLDLTVRSGEVYGYLGPNGAGKTTTIRLLMGMSHPLAANRAAPRRSRARAARGERPGRDRHAARVIRPAPAGARGSSGHEPYQPRAHPRRGVSHVLRDRAHPVTIFRLALRLGRVGEAGSAFIGGVAAFAQPLAFAQLAGSTPQDRE